MFRVGQQVIYGGNGVCRIEDIVLRENALSGDLVKVYVIRLSSGLTSYIPVDSNVFMRALVSAEEVHAVIEEFPSLETRSFSGTNSKALADKYRAIIARHDVREMLCLYKSLQQKIELARSVGKKSGAMDERFAGSALEQVIKEFAVVLDRPQDEILALLGIAALAAK